MIIHKDDNTNIVAWGDAFNYQVDTPVDSVIIDPPYMVKASAKSMAPIARPDGSGYFDGVTEKWDADVLSRSDHLAFIEKYVSKVREVIKEDGTAWIFGQYHNIHDVGHAILNSGGFILNEIIWIKTNPAPQFRGVRFCNSIETILWYRPHGKGKYHFDYHALKGENGGKQMRADWYFPVCGGKERLKIDDPTTRSGKAVLHQTQKPLALIERMIKASTRPGEVVMDFMAGIGTTGVAAEKLDRQYILVEKEKRYVDATVRRLLDVTKWRDIRVITPTHILSTYHFLGLLDKETR